MRPDMINDNLLQQALQITGLSTEKEVIEAALQLLVLSKGKRGLGLPTGEVSMSEDFNAPLSDKSLITQLLDNPLEPLSDPTPFSRAEIYDKR